jgi:hypothetical protein
LELTRVQVRWTSGKRGERGARDDHDDSDTVRLTQLDA